MMIFLTTPTLTSNDNKKKRKKEICLLGLESIRLGMEQEKVIGVGGLL